MAGSDSQDNLHARVEQLRRELREHDRSYYLLDDPTVGDDEYDALLNELRQIEAAHPMSTKRLA